MGENKQIDIIKGAILLEHRGKALYESVVKTTKNNDVKELFEFLGSEEEKHIGILNKQFNAISKDGGFDLAGEKPGDSDTAEYVISKDIAAGISGAGYEAAVISAALDFEKKAVEYYSKHAEAAEPGEEKKLYEWFANWETGHMKMLAGLEDSIKEQIWYDNSFWPLD